MGLLVGTMDIATANNTVAIVMANPIAKEMAEEYGITPRKTASLLDTFSCVFQGVIPYGAQMLVAISAVNELGGEISAFQIMPKLFYPMLLLLSSDHNYEGFRPYRSLKDSPCRKLYFFQFLSKNT
jgi:Na+/H+ antiporter NhaC